jgi:hypothetical protein
MKRIAWALALLLVTTLVSAAPALADDVRGARDLSPQRSSVFPTPRDPWRSWGDVRRGDDRSWQDRGSHDHRQAEVAPAPVWVPGRWVWDGAGWVWWPGYWAR